jgi:electron transfer flavoprotein alpha subunit
MTDVLVVAEHLRGRLADITGELVGAGRQLKSQGGGELRVLIIADTPEAFVEELKLDGVDEIILAPAGAGGFDGRIYSQTVVAVAMARKPAVILTGHTADGMTFAPGVAARIGAGFASDIIGLGWSSKGLSARRRYYDAKIEADISFPGQCVNVLMLAGATFAAPGKGGDPMISTFQADTPIIGTQRHVRFIEPEKSGVDIGKALAILSIGRGVQEADKVGRFSELAERLGMTLGCSRPVADSGWLAKGHQVGLTGTVASNCKIYVALGISGAVQHLYGMKHVDTIIAVNTDPNAAIFGVATYGICMDMFEFADALEKHFN